MAGPVQDYFIMVPLLGKIREINGMGRNYSLPLGKVSSGTEFMPTGSYLTHIIKAKWAKLNRSSIRGILLALNIEDSCRQLWTKDVA